MRTEQEAKEEEADIQRARKLLIWVPETDRNVSERWQNLNEQANKHRFENTTEGFSTLVERHGAAGSTLKNWIKFSLERQEFAGCTQVPR